MNVRLTKRNISSQLKLDKTSTNHFLNSTETNAGTRIYFSPSSVSICSQNNFCSQNIPKLVKNIRIQLRSSWITKASHLFQANLRQQFGGLCFTLAIVGSLDDWKFACWEPVPTENQGHVMIGSSGKGFLTSAFASLAQGWCAAGAHLLII